MKTYRGFLLDADNTLFDYDTAEAEALNETLAEAAPMISQEKVRASYRAINAGYWKRFEEGSITLAGLKVGRFADLLETLGVPGNPRTLSERYLDRLARKAYFLPRAREVVEALSSKALLCLITNGISSVQRGRLALSGIEDRFSAVLVSEELGMAKPDRRFFHAASDALRLPVSELLCVGDNPVTDVAGARDAGIDACWYAPSGAPWPGPGKAPELIVRDLWEIVAFAGGVFPRRDF